MKAVRFRIAWVMVAVTIAALDFAAIRAGLGSPRDRSLVFGALPMANVLAVALLIGQQRPGCRPFLLGFELFGAIALALFVILANSFPDNTGPMRPYLALGVEPVAKVIGRGRPLVFIPVACSCVVFLLGWPQVAFALIGGLLSRKFKVTIARR